MQRSLASAEESSADLWMNGINFFACLYHNQGLSLPVGFEMVRKPNAKVFRGPAALGECLKRASIEQRKIKSLSMTGLVGLDGVRVYALQMEDLVALAKSRLTRSLTTEECQKYLHVEQCPLEP